VKIGGKEESSSDKKKRSASRDGTKSRKRDRGKNTRKKERREVFKGVDSFTRGPDTKDWREERGEKANLKKRRNAIQGLRSTLLLRESGTRTFCRTKVTTKVKWVLNEELQGTREARRGESELIKASDTE